MVLTGVKRPESQGPHPLIDGENIDDVDAAYRVSSAIVTVTVVITVVPSSPRCAVPFQIFLLILGGLAQLPSGVAKRSGPVLVRTL